MRKYKTVKLEGLELFVYLMDRFDSTPEEALATMKEHGQDTTTVEKAITMWQHYEIAKKQQQAERENNEDKR